MKRIKSERVRLKAKRTFMKKGTCSRTFFYLLDREFGHPREEEEKAIDPLAGGILQQGYQCGMLWGASMAAGAEAFRRLGHPGQATALAILATQELNRSFVDRTSSTECEDITQTDFQDKRAFTKYMLTGKFVNCFFLAGKWAPEALEAARKGLDREGSLLPEESLSCASELVRQMGGSEEEAVMVAGFAGGLGLEGSGCGALAAAVWMHALIHHRKTGKAPSFDPDSNPALKPFYEETDYEIECEKICGRRFNSLEEHTGFLKEGGCKKLLAVLKESVLSN